MESVLRGLAVYVFLLFIFRIAGNRTLTQSTNFDLVLLLIISETVQEAMVDGDRSVTNSFLLIMTLVGATVALSFLKQRFPTLDKWLEGTALVIVENGKANRHYMDQLHIDDEDIMTAARASQGLERMDQIKYAIVERNGEITIIAHPK